MTQHPTRGADSRRRPFLVLLTASLVSSLIMLDSNIVAVSLPSIAASFGATFADMEWVVSAYVLPFAALLLAAGSFGDLHGRRRAALIGLVVFTAASAACGLATSAAVLNGARAVQGVGASLLLTAALAIINHAFRGAERARAYAFWGACLGIAITSGPIVGGAITALFGWRWAFLVNVPVCVALVWATLAVVEESRDPEAKHLDFAGVLTFSAGLFLLTWALIEGNALGWRSTTVLWRLGGATLLLAGFIAVELAQTRPMVDLSLFRSPLFVGSACAMLGYAAGAQVMIFYLPLVLQVAYGFAPAAAGLAMLPFALPMFLAPRLAGTLAGRYPGGVLLGVGLAMTCTANLALAMLAGSPYPAFALAMALAGCGAGLLNSETAKVMQSTVPPERAGMASGLSATTRFAGLLVGVAGLGAVLVQAVTRSFAGWAETARVPAGAAAGAARRLAAGDVAGAVAGLPETARAAAAEAGRQALAAGFGAAAQAAAVVAGAACVLALLLVRADEGASLARAGSLGAPVVD